MDSDVNPSGDVDKDIQTSSDFLWALHDKGYKDEDLRRYLSEKRGLSQNQVKKAFALYRSRVEMGTSNASSTEGVEKKSNWSKKEPLPDEQVLYNSLSYLLPERISAGVSLTQFFLTSEWEYLADLQCLRDEYYPEMVKWADENRFDMTRKEVETIFKRIPEFLRFHIVFHTDLKSGCSVAPLFVGHVNFFKVYAAYMSDCLYSTQTFGRYVNDKRLNKCLKQIKDRSIRKFKSLFDLLLLPLSRMRDYKFFLQQMFSYVDSNEKEFQIFERAVRRIGRISDHIEQYRSELINRNEMNKIQIFLGDQCLVLSPNRRLMRRGMMVQRKVGWKSSKKNYIFFLFNDSLLWANKKGVLQNVVELKFCQLLVSDEKVDAKRKFKIVVKQLPKTKTLLFECLSIRQRNGWYRALEQSIAATEELTKNNLWQGEMVPQKIWNSEEEDENPDDDSKSAEIIDAATEYEGNLNLTNKQIQDIAPLEDSVSVRSISDYERSRNQQSQDDMVGSSMFTVIPHLNFNKSRSLGHLGDTSPPRISPIVSIKRSNSFDISGRKEILNASQEFRDNPLERPRFSISRRRSRIPRKVHSSAEILRCDVPMLKQSDEKLDSLSANPIRIKIVER